jgi:hypothetical protein
MISRTRSRLRAAVPLALPFPLVLALALAACAGDDGSKRAGPPGGGVDPSTITSDNLSMSSKGGAPPEQVESSAVPDNPAPVAAGGAGGPTPSPAPAAPGAKQAPATASGASFVITAEHCNELGRKFTQLTLDAGGTKGDAKKIGDDFAAKCKKDKVGEAQEKREYDCILAVKSVMDIEGCK